MNKTEKIRLIYSVFLGVFCTAVGIAIICVAADIYYSGAETGVYYTREIAADRILKLTIPCVLLIVAIIIGATFPLVMSRVRPKAEDGVKRLVSRMPTDGSGEAYETAAREYDKAKKVRFFVWLGAMALVLAAAIVMLWYLVDTSHFSLDSTASMLALVKVVMPVTAAALVVLAAAAVVNGIFAKKQLAALKSLIKNGNGKQRGNIEPQLLAAIKSFANSNITVWVVRGIVFAIAVVFIILGVLNGGATDVLVKAINICTECIGLG